MTDAFQRPARPAHAVDRAFSALRSLSRADQWWNFKLAGILSAFYATALVEGQPLSSLGWQLGQLLVAIVAQASYVSLVNDLTDLSDDAAGGRTNRLAGRSPAFRAGVIGVPIAAGACMLYLWRDAPLTAALYLAGWISFTLYSVPPVRLKTRGFAGVLADACGAHVLPCMTAAAFALAAMGHPPDILWLAAIGCWSLGYGVRGHLWHQLSDRATDRMTGASTFAARHPRRTAIEIGRWAAFPIELAGLLAILWQVGSLIPVIGLIGHVLLVWQRTTSWQVKPVLTHSRGSYQIVLHDYYDAILPVSLLLASTLAHPADLFVLASHLLLFHVRPAGVVRDAVKLVRRRISALQWI